MLLLFPRNNKDFLRKAFQMASKELTKHEISTASASKINSLLKLTQAQANKTNRSVSSSSSDSSPDNEQFSFGLRDHGSIKKQKYDFFLVLDFEATCDEINVPIPQVSPF